MKLVRRTSIFHAIIPVSFTGDGFLNNSIARTGSAVRECMSSLALVKWFISKISALYIVISAANVIYLARSAGKPGRLEKQ